MSNGVLTPRQRRFAQLVAAGERVGDAALAAGYSPKRPAEAGERLLRDPVIAGEIRMRMKERRELVPLDRERVLDGLARLAFEGETERIRLRALDSLAKHFALYKRPMAPPPRDPPQPPDYEAARRKLRERIEQIIAEREPAGPGEGDAAKPPGPPIPATR